MDTFWYRLFPVHLQKTALKWRGRETELSSIWSMFNKHKHQWLLETQTAYKIR